jgi:flagella basal body P-ring formation protein FlgA
VAVSTPIAGASGDIAVRRGEIITLVYVAPGIQLTARARAASDASVGDIVRVTNLQSNRTVEATVTGIAAASANFAR